MWFMVAYALCMVAFTGAARLGLWDAVRESTATAARAVAAPWGPGASVDGCVVVVGDATTIVSQSCVPVAALALAVSLAAVVGPRRPGWRILSVVLGVALVLAVNVVRVAVVALLAYERSPLLQPVHELVFPMVLVAVAVGSWALTSGAGRDAE